MRFGPIKDAAKLLGFADPAASPFEDRQLDLAYKHFCRGLRASADRAVLIDSNVMLQPLDHKIRPADLRLLSLLVRPTVEVLREATFWTAYWLPHAERMCPDDFEDESKSFIDTLDEFVEAQVRVEGSDAFGTLLPPATLLSIECFQSFAPCNSSMTTLRLLAFKKDWSLLTQTSAVDGFKFSYLPQCLAFVPTEPAALRRAICSAVGQHEYSAGPQVEYGELDHFFPDAAEVDPDTPTTFDSRFEISTLGCDRVTQEMILLSYFRTGDDGHKSLASALLNLPDADITAAFERYGTLHCREFVQPLCEGEFDYWPGSEDD